MQIWQQNPLICILSFSTQAFGMSIIRQKVSTFLRINQHLQSPGGDAV